MRASMIGLSALALVAAAAPALAQDAAASDFTLTGSAALVSDYRFRGLSQSNKKIAPQAGVTLSHSSGFYGSFWGSSIDSAIAQNADAELDLIGGYSTTVGGVTLDGGLLYYLYASATGPVPTDFLEIYGSAKGTFGPATIKGGFAYAPKQKAVAFAHTKDDNLYLYGEVSGTIPDTGFGVAGHIGYTATRSFLSGGLKNYWDGNVGVTYTLGKATVGLSYVDTDAPRGVFISSTGKNIAKSGIVGSLTVAF
jgi:uncharacterized protein (TIGR02001 family)